MFESWFAPTIWAPNGAVLGLRRTLWKPLTISVGVHGALFPLLCMSQLGGCSKLPEGGDRHCWMAKHPATHYLAVKPSLFGIWRCLSMSNRAVAHSCPTRNPQP